MKTNRILTLALSLLSLNALAARASDEPTNVPPDLRVPEGQKLALDSIGKGFQVYECRGNAPVPTSARWVFVAPDATLLDPDHIEDVLGTHFGGPTWQGNDLSTVVGAVYRRVPAPDPTTAIDWLLLTATSNTGGNSSTFGRVTHIQRLDTFGGIAPPACACDLGQIGTVAKVPYDAHYYFYVPHDHRP